MSKNSIMDNQEENKYGVPKYRNPPPPPENLEEDDERIKWTQEDPMVRELRTGRCNETYGPSPVKRMLSITQDRWMNNTLTERQKKELQDEMSKFGLLADQQRSFFTPYEPFELPVQKFTSEEITKRIHEQFVYCKKIIHSDYSLDRKKELLLSAIGTAVNFAQNVGTLEAYSILAEEMNKANIKMYE